MSTVAVKSDLSEPRRRLVELMQELDFGRIESLAVRGGEPVLYAAFTPSGCIPRNQRDDLFPLVGTGQRLREKARLRART